MEVILKEDYPSLGYVGDRIAVKPGFARNFLLPRGIATEAFSNNARLLKHRLDGINAKRNRLKAEATEVAKRYEGLTLEFKLKMAGQERTFGSITARDIELALKEKDLVVDRRQIKFGEAVKRVGTYQVQIKLH